MAARLFECAVDDVNFEHADEGCDEGVSDRVGSAGAHTMTAAATGRSADDGQRRQAGAGSEETASAPSGGFRNCASPRKLMVLILPLVLKTTSKVSVPLNTSGRTVPMAIMALMPMPTSLSGT